MELCIQSRFQPIEKEPSSMYERLNEFGLGDGDVVAILEEMRVWWEGVTFS